MSPGSNALFGGRVAPVSVSTYLQAGGTGGSQPLGKKQQLKAKVLQADITRGKAQEKKSTGDAVGVNKKRKNPDASQLDFSDDQTNINTAYTFGDESSDEEDEEDEEAAPPEVVAKKARTERGDEAVEDVTDEELAGLNLESLTPAMKVRKIAHFKGSKELKRIAEACMKKVIDYLHNEKLLAKSPPKPKTKTDAKKTPKRTPKKKVVTLGKELIVALTGVPGVPADLDEKTAYDRSKIASWCNAYAKHYKLERESRKVKIDATFAELLKEDEGTALSPQGFATKLMANDKIKIMDQETEANKEPNAAQEMES